MSRATPHSLTREEVFVVLEGAVSVRIAGDESRAGTGDAIVVRGGPVPRDGGGFDLARR